MLNKGFGQLKEMSAHASQMMQQTFTPLLSSRRILVLGQAHTAGKAGVQFSKSLSYYDVILQRLSFWSIGAQDATILAAPTTLQFL